LAVTDETTAFAGCEDTAPGPRVILAVDGSEHSLNAAKFLAGILPKRSYVRLVGVVGYEFNPDTHGGPVGEAQERLSHAPKPGVSIFDAPAQLFQEAGAEVSDVQRYGHPAQEILSEAKEWQANMVVVGHHDGPARWFFGSVAEALVKNSSVPLLIVPSG